MKPRTRTSFATLSHCCALLLFAGALGSSGFAQTKLTSGLSLDSSGNLIVNMAASGGVSNSVLTSGLHLDSSGNLLVDVAVGGATAFAGVPTGTCNSTQTAVDTTTGNFYSCVSGSWLKVGPSASAGNPGGSANQIQFNVGGTGFGGFTLGGDCTLVVGTGVITCTKTNGTLFAASATTDATNAANIASGTLPNGRISGLPLANLATQVADSVDMNATGGSAVPTAVAMPTSGTNGCAGTSNALTYNTTTHSWGCNTSIGGTVNVNGSPVASSNFNATTPAAGSNGLNLQFQVSGSNVSGEIVGDGNAAHCLSGVGTYVACSGGLAGLTAGQRAVPNSASTLTTSGPTYYTERLTGATVDARLSTCLTALSSSGGTCDMTAEPAATTSTSPLTISAANVMIIPPAATITFGNGFFFNITGANSGFACLQLWSCVFDASNNGAAGTITLNGTGAFTKGVKVIGGRMNKQTGNEILVTGSNNVFWYNWIVNAGQDAISLVNNGSSSAATQASIRYNLIDQSGSAAALINNGNNSTSTQYNEIAFNVTRDANVNVLQNFQGTIGVGCSASNCAASPPTAHLADHNYIHDNVIINQYFGSGDCNNPNFGTLSIASWSGSGTTSITFTYTTAQPTGALPSIGQVITGASFATGGLNTTATVTASTANTVTVTYGATVTGSTGTGTITYTPQSTDTGCSEGIQTTDPVWYTSIVNNHIYNASKEGIAFSGIGSQVTGNTLDACGIHTIPPTGGSTNGCIAWEKSSPVQASPGYVGDTVIANNLITNSSSTTMRYGIQHLWTGTGSGPYTYQNAQIIGNIIDGTNGSGGITNGILLNTSNLTGGNITLKNFWIANNSVFGNVTTAFNPNSYTNITGVARFGPNGFNASADSAPVANDCVKFDANLMPTADAGGPCGGSVTWDAIGNPVNPLSLTMGSNTSTFNTTSAVSAFFKWANTTAATSGASQSSPVLNLLGTEWHAAASTPGGIGLQFVPGTGTDAASTAIFSHIGSATGAVTTQFPGAVVAGNAGPVGGVFSAPEGTTTAGASSVDNCGGDSTAHGLKCSFNADGPYLMERLVASGTSAMGTGGITTGTCATVVTTAATGAATTDNLIANPTADPTGVTGYAPSASGSLYIQAYITSGNVNFKVCNNTSGTITPSALTMQWRVIR